MQIGMIMEFFLGFENLQCMFVSTSKIKIFANNFDTAASWTFS